MSSKGRRQILKFLFLSRSNTGNKKNWLQFCSSLLLDVLVLVEHYVPCNEHGIQKFSLNGVSRPKMILSLGMGRVVSDGRRTLDEIYALN